MLKSHEMVIFVCDLPNPNYECNIYNSLYVLYFTSNCLVKYSFEVLDEWMRGTCASNRLLKHNAEASGHIYFSWRLHTFTALYVWRKKGSTDA